MPQTTDAPNERQASPRTLQKRFGLSGLETPQRAVQTTSFTSWAVDDCLGLQTVSVLFSDRSELVLDVLSKNEVFPGVRLGDVRDDDLFPLAFMYFKFYSP